MYEKELQNAGLSEKEARVYLAALELGPDTAQNIAKKAGINRATTYVQIEDLKERGLISELEKGKKTLYVADQPERLLTLLNAFERDLDFKKEEIQRILPNLVNLFASAGERPKVRFYEGVEGTAAVREEFLRTKSKQTEGFINVDRLFNLFPKHETEHTSRRIAKGIKSLVIYTRKAGPIENATDHSKLREARYIAYEKLPLDADITIFDNKVSFASYNAKPIAVIIESEEIAATLRAVFYVIWQGLG